jgi:hypothetical protein
VSVVKPKITAVNDPAPPWTIMFALLYGDGSYIRIYEHYRQLSRQEGGGGRLQYFSYHYGPCGSERDEDGFPEMEKDCFLRIDIDHKSERHIHYAGEDHIREHRISGLNFDSITPFDFIRAVEKHRTIARPLHEILGFEVKAAK